MTHCATEQPKSASRHRPILLFLFGALIAAALIFLTTTRTASADREDPPVLELQAGLAGLIGGAPFDAMMQGVAASAEQVARIEELARIARRDVDRLTETLGPARGGQWVEASDAVSLRVAIAMAEISGVLTPTQRARLSAR